MSKLQISLDESQIYVGTYQKYNEGSIFGKWLKLSDYSNYGELLYAMKELHQDEQDPEFMLQDLEIPELLEKMGLVSEYGISSKIYEVMEAIGGCSMDLEILEAYADCFGFYSDRIEDLIEKAQESYQGKYDSDEDFTEELLTETGSIPKDLPSYVYIDWERTSRDIMYDYSTSNGYYFANL